MSDRARLWLPNADPKSREHIEQAFDILDQVRTGFAPEEVPLSSSDFASEAPLLDMGIKSYHIAQIGIHTAIGSMLGARDLFMSEIPVPLSVEVLLRTAKLGVMRAAYAVLPDAPDIRKKNAGTLLLKDCQSEVIAYRAFDTFERLPVRVTDAMGEVTERLDELKAQGYQSLADWKVIEEAVTYLGLYSAPEDSDLDLSDLAERFLFHWHLYSGSAHAYIWPLAFRTEGDDHPSSSGELSLTVNDLAVALYHVAQIYEQRRTGQVTTGI